jgi:ferric-dicitrate binding protein FerR (iron transport regulator)
MDVSSAVVSDLWPVYSTGEASPDTRTLVEAFLAADPAFAQALRDSSGVTLGVAKAPALSPDHELKTLALTKRRLWGYLWLLQLAIMFSCFAFGRIVADTSWDVSPRNFIVTASLAAVCWIAFFVSLIRIRARVLIVAPAGRVRDGK